MVAEQGTAGTKDGSPMNVFWKTFLIIAFVALFAAFVGFMAGRGYMQNCAIEAGVARYEANPKTGTVRFVYNTGGEK